MSGLLLDTHIWIWFLSGSPRLPAGLRKALETAPVDCWVSPVSGWEVGMLAARGRIELGLPLRRWISEALSRFPVREAPLTMEVALRSLELKTAHPDPADRLIAATAATYDLVLATVDPRLTRLRGVRTRSR